MRKIIYLLIGILLFSINVEARTPMKTNVLTNKPYVTLKINKFGARLIVYVNGYDVYTEFSNGPLNIDLPVNYAVSSGKNTLEAMFWPLENETLPENAYFSIEMVVQDNDDKTNTQYSIATLAYREKLRAAKLETSESSSAAIFSWSNGFVLDDKGNIKIGDIHTTTEKGTPNILYVERTMELPLNLPRWKFLDSELMMDVEAALADENDKTYDSLRSDLYKQYKIIQNALERKDVNSIVKMLRERNKEYDQAFYYPAGTMEKKITTALSEAVNDPDLKLVIFSADDYALHQFKNRKLIKLVGGGWNPLISFDHANNSGSESYDFIFRKENGQWIITR